uniref:FAD-dependent oxidoreductase n=1 Tax=Eiseniibacteriota bacterium TaxID=2212470 RepID=A0A832MJV6_UNCEI
MTQPLPARERIAVIGAGVAGLTAAWLLGRRHDVVLFEREGRLGGHTHTVVVEHGPDAGLAVDTGFIVLNRRNYPTFVRILDALGVALQPSDMSFGYHCERSGFQYAGTGLAGLFARRRNLASARFGAMLLDIARFNARARRDLAAGAAAGRTLAEYVGALGLSEGFSEWYLFAMGSAIWSAPRAHIGAFPAEAFLRFFENHGLLGFTGQPRWLTVTGGSHTYVRAMLAGFSGEVRTGARIAGVRRPGTHVEVASERGVERFDRVVLAAHADESLALLEDPDPEERRLLGAWRYSVNEAVLHTDERALPPRRAAWASWNLRRAAAAGDDRPVSVTYWMNRLQRLATPRTYCVTLNGTTLPRPERIVRAMTYTHPVYTFESLATQARLPALGAARRTHYCGSYFGWGFHEDAARSGAAVAAALGCPL